MPEMSAERYWDDPMLAGKYDEEFKGVIGAHVNRAEVDTKIEEFEIKGRPVLLDAGCGTGRHLIKLPESVRYIGVDTSLPMLQIAKRRAKAQGRSGHFVACDITQLPFKNGVFDGVMSTRVLQHITNQGQAVAECARATKIGGQVVILVYNSLTIHCLWKCFRHSRLAFLLGRMFGLLSGGRSNSLLAMIHRNYYNDFNSVPEMKRLFSKAGIKVHKVKGTDISHIWFVTNFRLATMCERFIPRLLARYFSLCERVEAKVSERVPFVYLLDKIVVKGIVNG